MATEFDSLSPAFLGEVHHREAMENYFVAELGLIGSAIAGNVKGIQYALHAGEDIHLKNDLALRCAARFGHLDAVKMLVAADADIRAENDWALRWAAAEGYTEIVKVLLEAGADAQANNRQAERWALQGGYDETAAVLRDWVALPKPVAASVAPASKREAKPLVS